MNILKKIFLMTIDIKERGAVFKATRAALLGSSLLGELFYSFFSLMPFILRKDLFATTFQLSLFTTLKPAVSVLSFYWSSRIVRTKRSLRGNLVVAGILARVPFLLFPFFGNIWYMIFASAIYMLFSRAAIPAWMEVLKLNLDEKKRDRLFSRGAILGCIENVMIALLIGFSMDSYKSAWKVIFVITSILGIVGVYLQWRTPICSEDRKESINRSFLGVLKPWRDSFSLLKKRRDFLKYQMGTFIAMFGFMMSIPAIYLFYSDYLALTHTQMTVGRYIVMGVGYVIFSAVWARAMQKFSIDNLTGIVCFGFSLFPLFLIFAIFNKVFLFLAFLSYGITQSGSHLIWNLSGPIFAGDEDSSKYSRINVLMVGVRGTVAPLLGGLLCEMFGVFFVFSVSIFMCIFGTFYMFLKKVFLEEES